MKRKLTILLLCFVLLGALYPVPANADIGPKPSVHITFENMGDQLCYGTLLSQTPSTGPASAWDGNEEHIHTNNLPLDIWRAFVDYKDEDGYFFLQWGWQVNESHSLDWGYRPPQSFKILLYYPETDTFIVSGIYERYAFDTYYTVNMDGIKIDSVDVQETVMTAVKSYDYTWELISLACRIILTVLIEIGIAVLFGFRQKQLLKWIAVINIVTQVILNVLLNVINYNQGSLAFFLCYILFELVVLVIETILYCFLLNRLSQTDIRKGKAAAYALVANLCSFLAGWLIAIAIPGIF